MNEDTQLPSRQPSRWYKLPRWAFYFEIFLFISLAAFCVWEFLLADTSAKTIAGIAAMGLAGFILALAALCRTIFKD